MLLLRIILAQARERAADRVAFDFGVYLELAALAKLLFRQAALASDLNIPDPGRLAGDDLVVEIDERVGRVEGGAAGDLCRCKSHWTRSALSTEVVRLRRPSRV